MGYTVYHSGGNDNGKFEAYLRLLRQSGVDLGHTPRVPEPGTNNKWLYLWGSSEEAHSFRNELVERTGDSAWEVAAVDTEPSQGPLGPIIVLLIVESLTVLSPLPSGERVRVRGRMGDGPPIQDS
jgi:hypothetical protein